MLLLVLLAGAGSVAAELPGAARDSALALRVALGAPRAGMRAHRAAARGAPGACRCSSSAWPSTAGARRQRRRLQHAGGRRRAPSSAGRCCRRSTPPGPPAGSSRRSARSPCPGSGSPPGRVALAVLPLALLAAPFLRHDHGSDPATTRDPGAVGVRWRTVVLVGLGLVSSTRSTPPSPRGARSTSAATPSSRTRRPHRRCTPSRPSPTSSRSSWPGRSGTPRTARFGRPDRRPARRAHGLRRARGRRPRAGVGLAGRGRRVLRRRPRGGRHRAAVVLGGRPGRRRGGRPGAAPARVDAVVARFNQFNYAGPSSARCSPVSSGRARCASGSPCRWCSCSACCRSPATSPRSAPPTDPPRVGSGRPGNHFRTRGWDAERPPPAVGGGRSRHPRQERLRPRPRPAAWRRHRPARSPRPRRPRRPRTRTRRSSGRTTANPRRGTSRSRRCP